MGKLIRFWQKDVINKLIVLVALFIVVALGVQIYVLVGTPVGKSFLSSLVPTPTLDFNELFKHGEETSTAEAVQTRAAIIPTITTMPFTPLVKASTPSSTPSPSPTAPPAPGSSASSSIPSPSAAISPTPTPTRRPTSLSGKCLPGKSPQAGKVVDVIDGNTVRVLVGDLVYTIRYIGVEVPLDLNYAQLSTFTNGQLVYAKEVKLYADGADKDDNNRLLRYVVVGDSTLVNQELIRKGLATAATTSYACAADFSAAEQDAKTDHIGIWKSSQP